MSDPRLTADRGQRRLALGLVGLVALTIAAAIGAAAWRSTWGTVAALGGWLLAEIATVRLSAFAVAAMRRANGGPPVRTALGMIAVVLLAGRCLSSPILVATAVTAAAVTGVMVGIEAARLLIRRLRRLPLATRNIDLGGAGLPAAPPAIVMNPWGLHPAGPLLAAVGLAISSHRGGAAAPAAIGLAAAGVVAVVPAAVLAWSLLALVRTPLRSRLTTDATAAIAALRPEVLLYFAATADELYQLRMWLAPLAALDNRVAIVVRSYDVFDALDDVTLPVICTPYNGTLASLPLPPRVVGLFVTHTGNNLSLIRRPEVRSVFIGHGDSDKPDSVNPFARVYDEVWVAGPLGRRRYQRAAVGVREAGIVEIGRPQVSPTDPVSTQPPTVVYAPTWEGWGDDPHHSSLAHLGVEVVAQLSARTDVQVRYRPHPLTGRRNPQLRAAHERIVGLIGQVPAEESLAQTFGSASGLIGDVSSVINDFLPHDRPYAVLDTRGVGRRAFVSRFPSAAGGFVLPPDLDGLAEFLGAVRGGADPTRTKRRELVADVLGDPATSQRRFAAAVGRLLAS